jgi:hypothetical protein
VTQYDNTNRGTLFTNDRKTSEKHPDLKGSINIEGKEYWLSGWFKTGKSGGFTSLSASPKEARTAASDDRPATTVAHDDVIPF